MKQNLIYFLKNSRTAIIVFYIVFISINIFFATMSSSSGSNGQAGMTVIFLFVFGLNSFKETFNYYMAMCQTRSNMFKGFLLSSGIIAAGMALTDTLLAALFNLILGRGYVNLSIIAGSTGFSFPLLVSMVFLYFMSLCLGYMVTVAYYRMNTTLKWVISAGVPMLIFFLIPYLDTVYFNWAITETFSRFLANTIFSINGYISAFSAAVAAAICAGFSYLGVRTAVIK